MKKNKGIVSVVLAMIMVMMMGLAAFAEVQPRAAICPRCDKGTYRLIDTTYSSWTYGGTQQCKKISGEKDTYDKRNRYETYKCNYTPCAAVWVETYEEHQVYCHH